MGRSQWTFFAVMMTLIFGTFPLSYYLLTHAENGHVSMWAALPLLFMAVTFVGLVGGLVVRGVQNAGIRRTGTVVTARVVHSRSSGYTNRVPNYEVQLQLPDGSAASLMYTTWTPPEPQQAVQVVVSARYPGRAALPPANTDF